MNQKKNIRKNRAKLSAIRYAQHAMKSYDICLVHSQGYAHSLVFKNNKPIKLSISESDMFDNIRTHWSIVCGVLCRNQEGKHYCNYVLIGSTQECTALDLGEIAYTYCKQLYEQAPNLHKLTTFFIASPYYTDIVKSSLLYKVLDKYQVLDLIGTNYEFNINKPRTNYHTKPWYELDIDFIEKDIQL